MAIRLSKGFGGSAASWLRQQVQFDLAQIQEKAASIKTRAESLILRLFLASSRTVGFVVVCCFGMCHECAMAFEDKTEREISL
jgi:hypothetical protein